jgi:hypothetical protein
LKNVSAILALLSLVFTAGSLWHQVNDLEERLDKYEVQADRLRSLEARGLMTVDALELWVEKWMDCREKKAAFIATSLECVERVTGGPQTNPTSVVPPP